MESTIKIYASQDYVNAKISELAENQDLSNYYTKEEIDTEIAERVGDTPVSEQISNAVSTKADASHTHTASDVGADASGSAASALSDAKSYTDTKIADLINSAPTTLDTLGEIATAMEENSDVVEALEAAIGSKASTTDVENVQGQIDDLSDLVGDTAVATQIGNAISEVQTQVDGRIPFDNTNIVTIESGDDLNNYKTPGIYVSNDSTKSASLSNTPLTTTGFKLFVIDGYVNGRVTQFITGNNNRIYNRIYNGTDWSNWVVPYTADNPQPVSLGDLGVTATATELNYVDGVTSSIQTQLDGKAASSHTHNYAGSSSAGGAATSATKVNKNLVVKLNGGSTEGTDLFTFNGSSAKTINVTPSAIGALPTSGGSITGSIYINNKPTAPNIQFKPVSYDDATTYATIQANAEADSTKNRFQFLEYSRSSTDYGRLEKFASFSLPNPDADMTADVHYQILTSKSPVTIEQGGTGATDASTARTKLGITPANIGAATSGHTHALTASTITGELPVTKGGTGATDAPTARTNLGITPANIGAVPTSRMVNGKALSANISLTASDVSAVSTSATDTQVLNSSLAVRGTATTEDSWKYLGVTRYITEAAKSYSIRMGINSDGSANFLLYDNSNSSTSVNMLSLGLEETSFKKPVNLESGGTGATTASEARTKLGITPANIGALSTSGGTITGNLTIEGAPIIANSNYYGSIWFNPTIAGGERIACLYAYASDANSSVINTSQVKLRQYSYTTNSTTALTHYDEFKFPETAADKTKSNSYNILTTKSAVTVEQGGTGATKAADALTNLGIIYSSTEPDYVAGRIWLKPV